MEYGRVSHAPSLADVDARDREDVAHMRTHAPKHNIPFHIIMERM